jgi:hypothetical protein
VDYEVERLEEIRDFGMKQMFVWHRVKLTDKYHPGGSAFIVAQSVQEAREFARDYNRNILQHTADDVENPSDIDMKFVYENGFCEKWFELDYTHAFPLSMSELPVLGLNKSEHRVVFRCPNSGCC